MGSPSWCSCAEAKTCCKNDTGGQTHVPSTAVICPGQPTKNYCDCDQTSDCKYNPSWCSCDKAKTCCKNDTGASSSSSSSSSSSEDSGENSDLRLHTNAGLWFTNE